MQITMLVKNSFEYDARVRREATSLVQAGHDVRVVALAAGGLPMQEHHDGGFSVLRVSRLYGGLEAVAGPSTTTPGANSSTARLAPRLLRSPPLAPLRAVVGLVNTLVVDRRMGTAAGAPDVVHAHDLNTLRAGRAIARTHGAQLVYDSHELHTHRAGAGWARRSFSRWTERRLVRHAAAIVTATETWARMLGTAHAKRDVVVLRNVPETTSPSPVDVRAETDLPEHMPVLIYQGSIQRGRGVEESLAALERLPDVGLVIVGYGAHRPALERRVAAMGIQDRVRFVGPVPNEELVAWTAGADVSLCLIQDVGLSYRTSLPNKLFESLMAGTPVLVSDFGEMAQVVRRTGAGLAVAASDPAAIAIGIRRLLDPNIRQECARRARAAATDGLNWERESESLVALYERLSGRL